VALVILDPFVKLHAIAENDNSDMEFVCNLLSAIAREFNVALDSPAHTHKGVIAPGDADARLQAIERWKPPPVWAAADGAALSSAALDAILKEIDAGLADGRRYSDSHNAKDRAAWHVVKRKRPD
jgi:hypothetical protein